MPETSPPPAVGDGAWPVKAMRGRGCPARLVATPPRGRLLAVGHLTIRGLLPIFACTLPAMSVADTFQVYLPFFSFTL